MISQTDWAFDGQENDLGGEDGVCDKCGSPLRYEHFLSHEKWGTLTVGTNCAERLTESKEATRRLRLKLKRDAFLHSDGWSESANGATNKKCGHWITSINPSASGFVVGIGQIKGKKSYTTVAKAKSAAFEALQDKSVLEYLRKKKRPTSNSDIA